MHVPQSFQENVCNKWIFGVVMEGGEGVALVIILCRLTEDLENHGRSSSELRCLRIHFITICLTELWNELGT